MWELLEFLADRMGMEVWRVTTGILRIATVKIASTTHRKFHVTYFEDSSWELTCRTTVSPAAVSVLVPVMVCWGMALCLTMRKVRSMSFNSGLGPTGSIARGRAPPGPDGPSGPLSSATKL